METWKKALAAAILVAALCVSGFALGSESSDAEVGSSDIMYINNEQDLVSLRNAVNDAENPETYNGKTIVLNNDLNLSESSWEPIGNGVRVGNTFDGNSFQGVFDGNNYTIRGLTIDVTVTSDKAMGLFGVVSGGTVKDLVLEDVSIAVVGGETVGGVVGMLCDGGSVEGCTVGSDADDSSISANRGLGGVVGRMTVVGTIASCTNYADVTGTASGNVGGIVGAAYYTGLDKEMTVSNCVNHGVVTSEAGYAGGIVGLSSAKVSSCTNNGAVNGKGTGVGGIVGLSSAKVSSCTNNGAVNGKNTGVGGIVGEQQNYGSITGCTNNADVVNTGAGMGTGGIVGWVRYSGSTSNYPVKATVSVSDCRNSGDVTSADTHVGGIVGAVYHSIDVTRCEVVSGVKVTGKSFVAGLIGGMQVTDNVDKDGNSMHPTDGCGLVISDCRVSCTIEVTSTTDMVGTVISHYASAGDSESQHCNLRNGSLWIVHDVFADVTAPEGTKTGLEDISSAVVLTGADGKMTAYATLAEAVVAAPDSKVTIDVYDELELASTLVIPSGKDIVLDLNGHILSSSTGIVMIENSGKLWIGNGSIICGERNLGTAIKNLGALDIGEDDGSKTAFYARTVVDNGGVLSIDGGTFVSVYMTIVAQKSSTTTISGGQFEANKMSENYARAVNVLGDVTITGGIFTSFGTCGAGDNYVNTIYVSDTGKLVIDPADGHTVTVTSETDYAVSTRDGEIRITGGDLTCLGSRVDFINLFTDNSKISLTGGTFRTSPFAEYIPEGYVVVENDDERFQIMKVGDIIDVHVTDIDSLRDALAGDILSPKNVIIDGALVIPDTLDLSIKSTYSVTIPSGSSLTVNGILRSEGTLVNNGTLTVSARGFIENCLNVSGEGTITGYPTTGSDGAYHISTPMGLQWMAHAVREYTTEGVKIVLDDDMTFPEGVYFTPIGYDFDFHGEIEGMMHTISGINVRDSSEYSGGLVNYAKGLRIADLTVENGSVQSTSGYIGALVGRGQDVLVQNVTVRDYTINSPISYAAGGLIGQITGESSDNWFIANGCTIDGTTVHSYANTGGIWGTSTGFTGTINLWNITFSDTSVSAENVNAGYLGGFGNTAKVELIAMSGLPDVTVNGSPVTVYVSAHDSESLLTKDLDTKTYYRNSTGGYTKSTDELPFVASTESGMFISFGDAILDSISGQCPLPVLLIDDCTLSNTITIDGYHSGTSVAPFEKPIVIYGFGHGLTCSADRMIDISSGDLVIRDLTITGPDGSDSTVIAIVGAYSDEISIENCNVSGFADLFSVSEDFAGAALVYGGEYNTTIGGSDDITVSGIVSGNVTLDGVTALDLVIDSLDTRITLVNMDATGIRSGIEGYTVSVADGVARLVGITYTVSFDMNGHGTSPAPQVVPYGGTVTKPSDPYASNYTFGGWYTDSACTTAYVFTTVVSSDMTLYAKWTYVPPTPSHTHSWGAGVVTKEATCTESGVRTYTCTGCGQTRTETIPATGHSWDAGTVTKEPTDMEEGVRTYTCTKCGETKTESIPKLEHVHVWNAGTVTKEPTCGSEGEITYTCTKCNEAKVESIPVTNNHVWDSGTVVKEPTETESGTILYTCTVCGQTKTATIAPKEIHKEESGGVTTTTESQVTTEVSEDGTIVRTETEMVTKEQDGKVIERTETVTSVKESEDMTVTTESVTTEKDGSKTETVRVTVESSGGDVTTEATVSGGEKAEITSTISGDVTDSTIRDAVRQTDEAERAIGDAAGSVSKQVLVESNEVTLSPSAMGVLSDAGVSITITGDMGDVSLDHHVSGNLLNRGEDVTISINEKTSGLTPEQMKAAGDSRVIELSARTSTEDIHILGGTAVVIIDMTGMDYRNPVVFWLKDDGTSERIDAVFGEGWAQIELSHFSLYYVAEDVSEPVDDNNTLLYVGIFVVVAIVLAACAFILVKRR